MEKASNGEQEFLGHSMVATVRAKEMVRKGIDDWNLAGDDDGMSAPATALTSVKFSCSGVTVRGGASVYDLSCAHKVIMA